MAANIPKDVRQEQEQKAWELRQRCWTEARIAEELGVDQSTVSRMLTRVRKRLAKAFEERTAEMKAEQTEQLLHIASEAMQAWEASKMDAEFERTYTKEVAPKQSQQGKNQEQQNDLAVVEKRTTTERRGQAGNSACLDQARAALADIRDIWGLDAPKKTDVTSDGQPVKALIGVDIDKI